MQGPDNIRRPPRDEGPEEPEGESPGERERGAGDAESDDAAPPKPRRAGRGARGERRAIEPDAVLPPAVGGGIGGLGDIGGLLQLGLPLLGQTSGPRVPLTPHERAAALRPDERMLILHCWIKSGLSAKDFGALVGLDRGTLYSWNNRFHEHGPAGLEDKRRGGPRGSRVSEATKRAILLLKEQNPSWGAERIHLVLLRSAGLGASANAIRRVLKEANLYEEEAPRPEPHAQEPRRFERARPNQLWQTDLFTFVLRRQNRRVYLVAFLDDHSRFMVGYGLHASASGALVREVFEQAMASWGAPEEVLTDNGPQYHTWRGKSEFKKLCERRGIRHIVSKPKHPQTLGKIERFWGTLWRELLETATFLDLADARRRVGLFIDGYNFRRPHDAAGGGLVPADRFFHAAPDVLATLKARVALNAIELAKNGIPRKDVYLTGRIGGVGISLHAEGDEVILSKDDGTREAVNLRATGRRAEPDASQQMPEPLAVTDELADPLDGLAREQAPGTSVLDEVLEALRQGVEKRPPAAPAAAGEPRLASDLEPVAGAEDEPGERADDELSADDSPDDEPRRLDEELIGIDDPPPGRPISMWIDEDALRTLAGDGDGEPREGAPPGREISLWIDEGALGASGEEHDGGVQALVDESPEREAADDDEDDEHDEE